MRIVRLQAEGFKRIVAVDISPEGDLVALGGDNGEGKSSVLDAIYAALGGAKAAPIKPVRTGEEYAIIRLDLGDLKVTRYFSADGTDRLKVENADGAAYSSAQTMLDRLVGKIAFDPLAFALMEPADQATELRKLVSLAVDPDEVAKANAVDYAARRDVNRDAKGLKARIEGIVIPAGDLGERPDREGIAAKLASAADTNGAIERDRVTRENEARYIAERVEAAKDKRDRAEELRAEAARLDEAAAGLDVEVERRQAVLDGMAALAEPVDTAKLRDELAEADRLAETFRRRDERDALKAEFDALEVKSKGLTAAMEARTATVEKALAEAEMPVPGLSLGRLPDPAKPDEPGELIVTLNGEPFSQSSTGEQLRVSARIAMAMNPKLRVMIAKQGAFLDNKGLAMLREIASEGDFQIWLETVGERDGVGIIMEGGKVRGAPEPERVEAPKRRAKKSDDKGEGDPDVKIVGDKLVVDGETVPEVKSIRFEPEPDAPTRRKPTAMREFTTPKPGDLFGGGDG